MPRRSQWAGNDEMWEYAADLARGGMTYRDIEGNLSKSEQRKRFRLLAVPSADTIRNNVDRLGLLDPSRPRSALPTAELESHHRGLTYLGLALREQVGPTSTRRRRASDAPRELESPHGWFGFDSGRLYSPEPQSREEFEVDEEWTEELTDPRLLSHYEYFVEHLEATAAGRKVAKSLEVVFELAERSTAAFQELQILGEEPTEPAPTGPASRRQRRGKRSLNKEMGAEDVSSQQSRSEHDGLRKSWGDAGQAAENLKRSLRPASLVRRIVQDGQCGICRLSRGDGEGI